MSLSSWPLLSPTVDCGALVVVTASQRAPFAHSCKETFVTIYPFQTGLTVLHSCLGVRRLRLSPLYRGERGGLTQATRPGEQQGRSLNVEVLGSGRTALSPRACCRQALTG